jgi:hypothetical protein
MFPTTKRLEYFRVVDDHSGDQRSQLIFLLDICFYLSVTNQNLSFHQFP